MQKLIAGLLFVV